MKFYQYFWRTFLNEFLFSLSLFAFLYSSSGKLYCRVTKFRDNHRTNRNAALSSNAKSYYYYLVNNNNIDFDANNNKSCRMYYFLLFWVTWCCFVIAVYKNTLLIWAFVVCFYFLFWIACVMFCPLRRREQQYFQSKMLDQKG